MDWPAPPRVSMGSIGGSPALSTSSVGWHALRSSAGRTVGWHALRSSAGRAGGIDPDGGITTTQFDADGNVFSVTDPLSHATQSQYDALNRLTTLTDARGGLTTMAFDHESNLRTLVDPVGNTTTFAYDGRNSLIAQTDPFGHTSTFAYDQAERLVSQTDRLGRVQNFHHDTTPWPIPTMPTATCCPPAPRPRMRSTPSPTLIWDTTQSGPRVYRARTYGPSGERVRDVDFAGRPGSETFPHYHDWLPNPTGGSPMRGPEMRF